MVLPLGGSSWPTSSMHWQQKSRRILQHLKTTAEFLYHQLCLSEMQIMSLFGLIFSLSIFRSVFYFGFSTFFFFFFFWLKFGFPICTLSLFFVLKLQPPRLLGKYTGFMKCMPILFFVITVLVYHRP